jgi:hypothetical protein
VIEARNGSASEGNDAGFGISKKTGQKQLVHSLLTWRMILTATSSASFSESPGFICRTVSAAAQ